MVENATQEDEALSEIAATFCPGRHLISGGHQECLGVARDILNSSWLTIRDARIWDEGALWSAVECGAVREGEPWLSVGDNPHRDRPTKDVDPDE